MSPLWSIVVKILAPFGGPKPDALVFIVNIRLTPETERRNHAFVRLRHMTQLRPSSQDHTDHTMKPVMRDLKVCVAVGEMKRA